MHDIAPCARPVIAICIDDLGEDLAGTDKAMALPQDVALSFLPYAETTPFLAEAAARKGHLVLAHVPMEALGAQDPGPMALKPGMRRTRSPGAWAGIWRGCRAWSGINNHEGSRFTADAAALAPVMATLRRGICSSSIPAPGRTARSCAVARGRGRDDRGARHLPGR